MILFPIVVATSWLPQWRWRFFFPFADTAAWWSKKSDFSQCLRPPCRGLHSGWWAGCPRPIDQRQRGLCIEAVCRAADAICTFVNYLHSAPQIWSIVNWASGSFRREKTCAGPGDGIVWRLHSYFPLIILRTAPWFPFHRFKYKRRCPWRLSKLSHASQLPPLSAVINAKLQHFKGE